MSSSAGLEITADCSIHGLVTTAILRVASSGAVSQICQCENVDDFLLTKQFMQVVLISRYLVICFMLWVYHRLTQSSSSSSSAILHAKGWRRVVSLSNYHDLSLLQPLRSSSSQSIRRCHLSNADVVDQGFCTLVHTLERFPSPDFRISVIVSVNVACYGV